MSEQSAKMWSGRFREPLDPTFDHWQRSFGFDRRLLQEEAAASKAHALALKAAEVLTDAEYHRIIEGLDEVIARFFPVADSLSGGRTPEPMNADAEDIHHFVEMKLVEAIGDLGLKLHTGRSRNEQIATDLRLYIRFRSHMLLAFLAAWALQDRKAHV